MHREDEVLNIYIITKHLETTSRCLHHRHPLLTAPLCPCLLMRLQQEAPLDRAPSYSQRFLLLEAPRCTPEPHRNIINKRLLLSLTCRREYVFCP